MSKMEHDLTTLVALLKGCMSGDAYGDFAESEMDYVGVAEYLITRGVIVQKCSSWIRTNPDDQREGTYKCARCNHEISTPSDDHDPYVEYYYCPMCGAKMKGED